MGRMKSMAANEEPGRTPPPELIIPRRIVVSRPSFEALLERMRDKAPTPALVALMRGESVGHPGD
jgi:hypothetical protein